MVSCTLGQGDGQEVASLLPILTIRGIVIGRICEILPVQVPDVRRRLRIMTNGRPKQAGRERIIGGMLDDRVAYVATARAAYVNTLQSVEDVSIGIIYCIVLDRVVGCVVFCARRRKAKTTDSCSLIVIGAGHLGQEKSWGRGELSPVTHKGFLSLPVGRQRGEVPVRDMPGNSSVAERRNGII